MNTWLNGYLAEEVVKERLRGSGIEVIEGILIPFGDGRDYQIDAVVVSNKGIFCIEIKEFTTLYRGGRHDKHIKSDAGTKVKNPVYQNKNHVKAIEGIIGNYKVEDICIFTKNIPAIPTDNLYSVDEFVEQYYMRDDILGKGDIIHIKEKLSEYIDEERGVYHY